MKKITLFHLIECPYCHNARKALDELIRENPAYGQVEIEWVEETEQNALAAQYDYYYVPTIFYGQTKLYEARPSERFDDCKERIRAALDAVLARV